MRAFVLMVLGLTAGDWLQELCQPHLSAHQSHIATLACGSLLAVVIAAWAKQSGTRREHASRGIEQELRAQAEQYRMVFDHATHGIYRTTPDGQILLANPALLEMLGFASLEELAARNLETGGTESDYAREEFRRRIETDGFVRGLEAVWVRKDGGKIFVRENAQLVRGPDGTPLFYEGSAEDVTAREEAETALRRSEARFARNAANVPGMVYQFTLHPNGATAFPYISSGCRDIYGLPPEQIQADPDVVVRMIHPADRAGFESSLAVSAQTGQPWHWEGRIVLPCGSLKWIRGASRPELQPDGDVVWDGLLLDITQTKIIQEALQRSHEELEDRVAVRTREIIALNAELTQAYDATIEGWSRALDMRDKETEGHCRRVTDLTLSLARALGLPSEELLHVRRGALLHDIGKVGIPDSILLKPGPLTSDEWAVMRRHPALAYEMLSPIAFLRPALDIPRFHHEKWDGTGYPHGLAGDSIPLAARLFAVVDVWDALLSDRPYREGWPRERVRAHIQAGAGTHFDPQVVEAFLALAATSAPATDNPLSLAA